jgi:hypothetical protein
MQTLSYGYFKPDTGDKGSVFFPKLELNWQRVNDHDHDGVNSKKISSGSISFPTSSLPHGSWAQSGPPSGEPFYTQPWFQTVLYPATVTKTTPVQIRDANTGDVVWASIGRSDTALTVAVNDNTLDLVAVYG